MSIRILAPCPQCGLPVKIYKGDVEERTQAGIVISSQPQYCVACNNAVVASLDPGLNSCSAFLFEPGEHSMDSMADAWNEQVEVRLHELELFHQVWNIERRDWEDGFACPLCKKMYPSWQAAASCHYDVLSGEFERASEGGTIEVSRREIRTLKRRLQREYAKRSTQG
jgi:hypothetical protein